VDPVLERSMETTIEVPRAIGSYTVSDVAQLTQSSERHVWRQIDLGRIPGVFRLGRLVRISKPIFDQWLATRGQKE
jgi:excisionase family DNA binding protein